MLPHLILLTAEGVVLFLLSKSLTRQLFAFFWLLTGSRPFAVSMTTIILFPGTVVHELSHLFTAEILGVRTGKLVLVPEAIDGQDDEMRTGSVAIASTDPFRRAVIGIAPIIVGLAVLAAITYVLTFEIGELWLVGLLYYLIFAVSTTMFSSPDDMKGFIPLVVALGLLAGAAYLVGLRVFLTGPVLEAVIGGVTSLSNNLGIVLAVNVALYITTRILNTLLTKVTRRKIV